MTAERTIGGPQPLRPSGRLEAILAMVRDVVARDERICLVGGAVRDMLLGRDSGRIDLDFAHHGDAAALARRLADTAGGSFALLHDDEKKVARVVFDDGAVCDFSSMATAAIEDDLALRDFTINAMAVPVDRSAAPGEPAIIDPFGGRADLDAGIVRVVDEGAFAADPLRMLRAFRFAATLEFTIEAGTLAAITRRHELAARPAPERSLRELFLTLDCAGVAPLVRGMDETGLLETLLPEIGPMRDQRQDGYHHLHVWEHSLAVLGELEGMLTDLAAACGEYAADVDACLGEELVPERTRRALVKLVCLLHDVAKPATAEERDGRLTFYSHDVEGARTMAAVARRLRLGQRELAESELLVRRHLDPRGLFNAEASSQKTVMRFFRRLGESGVVVLLFSLADVRAARGPLSDEVSLERAAAVTRRLIAEYYGSLRVQLETPPLLNGRDLMERFGLRPGPGLGALLGQVREKQLDGELLDRDEALAFVADIVDKGAVPGAGSRPAPGFGEDRGECRP